MWVQREFGWFRAKMRLVGCEIMVSKKDMWVRREFGWLRARMRLVGCEIMLGEKAFGWVRRFWVINGKVDARGNAFGWLGARIG